MDKKLGVIVPYRNRPEHLDRFKSSISSYLEKCGIPFEIIIIDQDNAKLFNRGMLLNIGFNYSLKLGCNYVVFHDIDLIPVNIDYTYTEFPIHLANDVIEIGSREKKKNFSKYFGGATLFNVDDFIKIYGYSNKYWGWGFEDDDLFLRCEKAGFKSDKMLIKNYRSNFNALFFNGINSFVKFKNNINLNGDLTIFISFYPYDLIYDHNKEVDTYTIFSIPGYDTSVSFNSFLRYNFCTFSKDNQPLYINSDISVGYFTTICIVFEEFEKEIKFYQDGVYIGKTEKYTELRSYENQKFMFLGAGNPKRKGYPNFFKGYLNEFAIISQSINSEEILNLVKTRNFHNYKEIGNLKVHYSADEIKNYEMEDLSGNGNNGRISKCEIISKCINDLNEINIPMRREGTFISMNHDNNGYENGRWKNQHTRWNQLRFHNEVSRNQELISSEGLSDLKFKEYGKTRIKNITHVNVGI